MVKPSRILNRSYSIHIVVISNLYAVENRKKMNVNRKSVSSRRLSSHIVPAIEFPSSPRERASSQAYIIVIKKPRTSCSHPPSYHGGGFSNYNCSGKVFPCPVPLSPAEMSWWSKLFFISILHNILNSPNRRPPVVTTIILLLLYTLELGTRRR